MTSKQSQPVQMRHYFITAKEASGWYSLAIKATSIQHAKRILAELRPFAEILTISK